MGLKVTVEFKVLHPPEIFGLFPSFVGGVAGNPIFVRGLVFSGLPDHCQKICDNRVADDFLVSEGGICHAVIKRINKLFNSFVRRLVIEKF